MARGGGFSVGSVLGRTFAIWGRNFLKFTLLSAILHSPLILYNVLASAQPVEAVMLAEDDPEYSADNEDFDGTAFLLWIAGGMLSLMATAAVIHGVLQQLRGKPVGIAACLRVCIARFFPALGVAVLVLILTLLAVVPMSFIMGAAVAARSPILALFGLIATVVAGLLVTSVFWVAIPVAIIEKPGVGASLSRSAALTKGRRWAILLILLAVLAIVGGTGLIVGVLSRRVEAAPWIELFISIVVVTLYGVATAVGYHDLRVAKEGVGIDDLVSVFA